MIGHADGMVRFLDAETVFFNDYSKVATTFGRRLQAVLRRASLNLIKLPYCPEDVERDGISSAVRMLRQLLDGSWADHNAHFRNSRG